MMTAAGGDPVNIEDVFHTQVYTGTNANQQVTNGIDLSTEGGLLWFKSRSNSDSHRLIDTERGLTKSLSSHLGAQETNYNASYPWLTSFNTDGFTIGNQNDTNYNGYEYVGWTFRKAPKFFDIVTYTGNGTAGRTISHNLGTTVGSVWVKRRDSSAYWMIYHKGIHSSNPEYYHLALNETFSFNDLGQSQSNPSNMWNQTAPTSTQITLGSDTNVNENNATYVAYVFAHNNNDGKFGVNADQDIIKCGSYTGNGSNTGPVINLGFEPQWLMIKGATIAKEWRIHDVMRGMPVGGSGAFLEANSSNAEGTDSGPVALLPNGFQLTQGGSETNNNNDTYIYMAIRRGPMAIPENASDVFAVDAVNTSATPNYVSGFPVDFLIEKSTGGSNTRFHDRLRGQNQLYADNDWAEGTGRGSEEWDHMTGVKFVNSSSYYCWMWKRAPHFMDTVLYDGDGSNTSTNTKPHSLGVKPEMIIIKCRSNSANWMVWHKDMNYNSGESYTNKAYMNLNTSSPATLSSNYWSYGGNPQMTDTVFSVGSTYDEVNNTSRTYCAWLFASLAGISKVGSYTGNGGYQVINCGFSNGARFVLIKRTDASGDWVVYDTSRGITQSTDPHIDLNNQNAETTGNKNYIYPSSSGFGIQDLSGGTNNPNINVSNATYVFYAIA